MLKGISQYIATVILSCAFVTSFAVEQAPATRTVMVPAPMLTISCSTCSTFASLQSTAQQFYANHNGLAAPGFPVIPSPLGNITYVVRGGISKIIVVSLQHPMSANFTIGATPTPISTSTDVGAYNFDNVAFARAAKLPIIRLPPGITTGDESEVIAASVQSILVPTGQTGIDWLAALTNLSQAVYFVLTDTQTGLTYKVFVGDTIQVQYADGSTEKLQYLGVEAGTIQFKRIPNSYRNKDGSKPTVPNTTSPPATGAGVIINNNPAPAEVIVVPSTDTTLPRGTVTVEDPYDPNGPVLIEFDSQGWFGDCGC